MIHNVEFNINLELSNLTHDQYLKLKNDIAEYIAKNGKMSFDELNELLSLKSRYYSPSSIDYPKFDHDSIVKESKINIIG